MTVPTLEKQLEDLAQHLVAQAKLSTTPLDQSTDAFKQLLVYYGMLTKKAPPPENGGQVFSTFQKRVRDAEEQGNGETGLPDRRRAS